MIYVAFILLGGSVGLGFRYYLHHFAEQVITEIYGCYCDIFPDNPPAYERQKSTVQPIKCGSNLSCFMGFSLLFLACVLLFDNLWLATLISVKCSLLATISLIDFHYKLIPTALCQQLMALGVAASYFHLLPLTLAESLQSGAIGFTLFWLIYYLAKYIYRTEALGRGDYWLIGGLATFHPWQALPQLIFTACIAALLYCGWLKIRQQSIQFIPFAPFLCFGGWATFGLELLLS